MSTKASTSEHLAGGLSQTLLPLPSPAELKHEFALDGDSLLRLARQRVAINQVVNGDDPRLLVVVGPCSLHDVDEALAYGQNLARLAARFDDRLLVVMRAYVEKPRTTLGWKGLVYDPHLDGSNDILEGLLRARSLLVQLSEQGLALATEALSPMISDYLQDLVCWTAIGARTTESQLHREMASGLTSAVGFKNGTDGDYGVAIQAMRSSMAPHAYPAISFGGRPEIRRTSGNANVHLVLRGGRQGPNYQSEHIRQACAMLAAENLPARVMVDCSHDNSARDFRRQVNVIESVASQLLAGENGIIGIMVESYLQEGRQALSSPLTYGVSITDGCLGWEQTEAALEGVYEAMASRF